MAVSDPARLRSPARCSSRVAHDRSLDLWMSDIVSQRMKAAMAALHQDPTVQDVHDFETTIQVAIPSSGNSPGATAGLNLPIPARVIPREESILCGTNLRDILLGRRTVSASKPESIEDDASPSSEVGALQQEGSVFWDDEVIRDWARRHLVEGTTPIETKHTDPECSLNRSQKRAIAAMLAYPVSLIQGVSRTSIR